uniref:Ribosomal protein L13 n=1 Tax=Harveyella mirabilis TaxID=282355 RepID=A0A3S8UVZ1_9FLOR|nr:ribosomal protein L13 [Harveyella mirabilis]
MNKNKTIITSNHSTLRWYIIDATNKNLGRLSTKIIHILKNKHNIEYLPYQIGNTNIIIINSKNINITGQKYEQKTYTRYSGKPGSLKIELFKQLQNRLPNKIIEYAIRGMLPKNRLGKKLFQKIKFYQDHIHPHASQRPIFLNIN